jgi:aminoglycoside 6'-N-acetyltransferase I
MIRRVDRQDAGEWLRMRQALWPDCPRGDHLSEMDEYFSRTQRVATFVATRAEGGLCGMLEASIRPCAGGCVSRPVGYIEGWYVDLDVRRRGIGAQLVRAAEAWAAGQRCRDMASDCVIDNEIGFQAHLALGYIETERSIRFKKPLVSAGEG